MENIATGFSYGSDEVGTMEFPTSLASSMDPSTSGSQTLLHPGMQYTHIRPEIQRQTFGTTQGNVAVQRTNAFEVPRFQLQYHQPLSTPNFTSFPGGSFNQLVTQRPQLTQTNLQTVPITSLADPSSFIPQAGLVQQQAGSLSGLEEKIETLPSFSSIVASAATSISTMNMQLISNSKDSDTMSTPHMFAVHENKMATTTPHSLQTMVDNAQVQQVFFAGPQFGAQLQPNNQQIPQTASGILLRNQFPAVQQGMSSQPVSQPAVPSQYNSNGSGIPLGIAGCVQSGQSTRGISAAQTSQGPVQILISSGISNPSFSAAGLIPLNISSEDQTVNHKDSNTTLPQDEKDDDNEKTPESIPENASDISAESGISTSSDSPDYNSLKNFDCQQMIHISKPSLKHTIKKYPPREMREKMKMSKPKSILHSLSSASGPTPFVCLGKFGDQSPWKHHFDCELYEFFDSIDLNDDSSDNETLLEDSNHIIKTDPENLGDSDKSQNEQSSCSSLAAFSDFRAQISRENENMQKEQIGVSTEGDESGRESETSNFLGRRRSRRSKSASTVVDNNLQASSDGVSDSVSMSVSATPGEPSVGTADDSSQENSGVAGGRFQQDSESDEEEHGAVFPGMDLGASGAVKPRTFFQVQPDLDDIPYFDNVDREAEMKRKVWQATKERLEMERMDVHVKIEDSQCVLIGDTKRWQCHLCPKNYTTKHNLVTHILDHNGIKPHLCMVCGKYFKQLSHLNTHMLTHDNIKPHVCPLCGKGFTQVSHLKRHQAVHLDNKPNICDICNRGFAYPSELRVHKEKHIPGRDKCVDCGEDFSSPRLLKQHQATHEQREELTCNQCNRMFRYPSQLRDHIVSHTGTRPFICTECGMDFMKEHHLKAHMFTHTGLRPYSCQECGRAFNQKANLQRHMLIHSSERAYKCDQCDKTFTQPQTLKAHMVVHAEKKPYWCNICGKEFGRLHNLQGHMHMHNNSKPYVCFCGSSFTLKGNLNRHKKVKHGLNESTESMEEEAVNFLNLMSERVREEKPADDDDFEGLDQPNHPETSDMLDSPPLDQAGDPRSHRRERKSTPRKIPRQRKSMESEDSSSKDPCEEEEETSKYFKAADENKTETLPSRKNLEVSSDEEEDQRSRKVKRGRRSGQCVEVKVKEEIGEESQSDNDEEVKGDEDEEWSPGRKRPRLRRGAKLDSIIAKKFQSV